MSFAQSAYLDPVGQGIVINMGTYSPTPELFTITVTPNEGSPVTYYVAGGAEPVNKIFINDNDLFNASANGIDSVTVYGGGDTSTDTLYPNQDSNNFLSMPVVVQAVANSLNTANISALKDVFRGDVDNFNSMSMGDDNWKTLQGYKESAPVGTSGKTAMGVSYRKVK
jgi:hypothetical protein